MGVDDNPALQTFEFGDRTQPFAPFFWKYPA
jgi:hypothetical protein